MRTQRLKVGYLIKPSFTSVFLLLIGVFLASPLVAQNSGKITGTITDAGSGEVLVGANVQIVGTQMGAATDSEGEYTIPNVTAGTYELRATYIGYERMTKKYVEIAARQSLTVDFTLQVSALESEQVEVEGTVKRGGELERLTEKKESVNFQDAVSSEQISKAGDSDAAEALRRITGVTIEDDKFAVVRGLGNRYTKTQLNNNPVPSPEPDKQAVPLNLFPSALLDGIVANKTFTPDMPGTFAGGTLDIRTKAYPDQRTFHLKLGTKHHSYLSNDYTYRLGEGGRYDYWGYDDGSRDLPDAIPEDVVLRKEADSISYEYTDGKLQYTYYYPDTSIHTPEAWQDKLSRYGRAFDTGFTFDKVTPSRPVSLGLNFGDRYTIGPDFEYGFFVNSDFSNSYSYKNYASKQYFTTGDSLVPSLEQRRIKETGYKTNLAGTFSSGFSYKDRHRARFQYLYTHTSNDKIAYGIGQTQNVDDGIFIKHHYIEKTISNYTLSGQSNFNFLLGHTIDWSYSTGTSYRYEPDTRRHNYLVNGADSTGRVRVMRSSSEAGQREFIFGEDNNANFDMNYTLTHQLAGGAPLKIKMGLRSQDKDRDFWKRHFYHEQTDSWIGSDRIDTDSLGTEFADDEFFEMAGDTVLQEGLVMVENQSDISRNAYRAKEDLMAGFLMFEVPLGFGMYKPLDHLRFIGGVRHEDYLMEVTPYNPVTGDTTTHNAEIDEYDILPSFNLIYEQGEFIVRGAYSETVGRGEFREIAPFAYQDFYGKEIKIGNPDLKTSRIYNTDFRVEWYPNPAELVSVGLFHKHFKNPIDVAVFLAGGSDRINKVYTNALSAETRGVEIEIRKKLNFIPIEVGYGSISLNTTISRSTVQNDSVVTFFTGYDFRPVSENQRPLPGQSDRIVNATLDLMFRPGYRFNLAYNAFSRRLSSAMAYVGSEYEFPFHSLNLTASRQFGHFTVGMKAKNLLNSTVRYGLIEESTGERKYTQEYKPGVSMSLSVSYDL